jgi:alpha-1,6-mannosyltransferase
MAEIQAGVQSLESQLPSASNPKHSFRTLDAICLFSGLLWCAVAYLGVWHQLSLPLFLGLLAALWLLSGLAYRAAGNTPAPLLLGRLWLVAIIFRAIAFWGPPLFEDDHFRYLWDGRVFATTGNPYASTPLASFADPSVEPAFGPILDGINYPQLSTVYGPIAELGFLFAYSLSPASLWPWKLLCFLSQLACLALLSRLIPPRQLLLFATCPLLIHELGFNAHTEALLLFFLVLAIYLQKRGRHNSTALALAACIGVKLSAGLFVPFLLGRSPRSAWLLFVLAATLSYLPFGPQAFAGLQAMAQSWEFNSSLFAVFATFLSPPLASGLCTAILLAGCLLLYGHKSRNSITSTISCLSLFLLLSPVVNPWYLAPLVPLVLLESAPTLHLRFAWPALILVSLSYATGLNLPQLAIGPYEHPQWLRPLEYGAILAAGLASFAFAKPLLPRPAEALP